jgi:hypothetical protein
VPASPATIILTDTSEDFERRLRLPNQLSLAIIKRPACTWDTPAIIECHHGGVRLYPEVQLVYATPTMRHVLVSFTLPWG